VERRLDKSVILYRTPNNYFVITEQSDPEWQKVFGFSSTYYNVSKIRHGLMREDESELFEIIYSAITLEQAFKWLRWIKVISSDEMKFQIEKFRKEENKDGG